MGFLADVLAVVALIFLWSRSSPKLWWTILALFIANLFFVRVLKESIRMNGKKHSASIFYLVICTVLQLSIIVLAIIGFTR